VGVDVDDARDHPLPRRIDDIGPGGVQWSGGDGGDTAVMNTDVSQRLSMPDGCEPTAGELSSGPQPSASRSAVIIHKAHSVSPWTGAPAPESYDPAVLITDYQFAAR
jgi:hypothetical protein